MVRAHPFCVCSYNDSDIASNQGYNLCDKKIHMPLFFQFTGKTKAVYTDI